MSVRAEKRFAYDLLKVFRAMAKKVAEHIRSLAKVQKAGSKKVDPKELDNMIDVDLTEDWKRLADLDSAIAELLTGVTFEGSKDSLAQIGVAARELLIQANERAIDYARTRSAEMVGMKWVDGELVPNPNAEWAINETTRDFLRTEITNALEAGEGMLSIADRIMTMPDDEDYVGAFTKERAEMIARTEVIGAHNQGTLEGYRTARDNGVNVMKEWHADNEACDICLDNVDDGPIDLDDEFSSGDDAPPAHPNCECSLVPSVEETETDTEE